MVLACSDEGQIPILYTKQDDIIKLNVHSAKLLDFDWLKEQLNQEILHCFLHTCTVGDPFVFVKELQVVLDAECAQI